MGDAPVERLEVGVLVLLRERLGVPVVVGDGVWVDASARSANSRIVRRLIINIVPHPDRQTKARGPTSYYLLVGS